jgi:hypothetical protein
MKDNLVTIGLRAKTGRAIAVVLGGSIDSPRVVTKLEIKLVDPKIPSTSQPYHEVMDLPWEESQQAVRKSAAAIEAVARGAMARLIKQLQSQGMKVYGAGIVGSKDRDLARIGNYHIRAHAAEGLLFRRVLDLAADTNGLKDGPSPIEIWSRSPRLSWDFRARSSSEGLTTWAVCSMHLGELMRNKRRLRPGWFLAVTGKKLSDSIGPVVS